MVKRKRQSRKNKGESTIILIDAYNLIHADPALKTSLETRPEIARDHVRTLCRHYARRHPTHTVFLVFDGDSSVGCVPDKSRSQILNSRAGIREVFTASGESADRRILLEVRRRAGTMRVRVVTHDRAVLDASQMAGADVLTPDAFTRESRPPEPRKSRRPRPSRRDTADSGRDKGLNDTEKDRIFSEFEDVFGDEMDRPL